jgi:HPt (histidine-containing phosphotransfer) domain-containing protein
VDNTLIESVFDKAALLERFGGDRQAAGRAVQAFLEEVPWLLLDLRKAQQTADPRAFTQALAALKGTLRNLFAHSAYELAQRLESRRLGDDPLATEQLIESLEAQTRVLVLHLEDLRDELDIDGCSPPVPT